MPKITVEVSDTVYSLLKALTFGRYAVKSNTVEEVVSELIDHAQQGVYRPGAWERQWLIQVFGEDFLVNLEPGDPYGRPGGEGVFQRPKKGSVWA